MSQVSFSHGWLFDHFIPIAPIVIHLMFTHAPPIAPSTYAALLSLYSYLQSQVEALSQGRSLCFSIQLWVLSTRLALKDRYLPPVTAAPWISNRAHCSNLSPSIALRKYCLSVSHFRVSEPVTYLYLQEAPWCPFVAWWARSPITQSSAATCWSCLRAGHIFPSVRDLSFHTSSSPLQSALFSLSYHQEPARVRALGHAYY